MKKLLGLLALVTMFSCSDGDLQIETIDFDSVSIQQCGTVDTTTVLFFKINADQALILNLQSGLLSNEATTESISSSVPGQSQVTYRIFSETVTSNYFCDDIPPVTPVVTEEIEAEDGEVLITTVANETGAFEHTIQLQNITLVNDQGERITDLTISEFGTVTTTAN
ncbi:hypothetical protein ABV409_11505 [Flagellimonas sp. DF-77]|uniref:hypothetical protein n=1 Tax=Flagellimonas algarum TaxID=3230298 RepID=UPI00339AB123